ncbi:DUF805 domain-containing protein [Tsuneonella amylolytica]|uniref:DUF805 domain-containing protein n=1 Tax=Tsuneonella amylolytica TaxID=2338327 RepID=UPI000EA89410|nr:DUF805 domain-containing protein [Tsuneonella amylolytica]
MIESIRYHLGHLFDLSGREARTTFWLWVLAVIILNIVVSIGFSLSTTADAMGAAMENAGRQDAEEMRRTVMASMLPGMKTMLWVSIGLSLVNCVLLGAALVRRAKDAGLPGAIVLIPFAALALSTWFAIDQIGEMETILAAALDPRSVQDAAAIEQGSPLKALIGWVPLISLIAIGLLKSKGASQTGD